jgi:DNA invertase Pin-like site-specific DNA recombinase
MAIVGYARVSKREQNLDMQIDSLKKEGCTKIFTEKICAVKAERPEFEEALKYLRSGDTFLVWRLDRMGRSLKELVFLVESLNEKNIAFKSIQDNIDTNSALGRCQFGIFASFAQYERELIIERTIEGLEAARRRGRIGGRKKGLSSEALKKAKTAKQLYEANELNVLDICKILSIKSKATLYRYLKFTGAKIYRRRKK